MNISNSVGKFSLLRLDCRFPAIYTCKVYPRKNKTDDLLGLSFLRRNFYTRFHFTLGYRWYSVGLQNASISVVFPSRWYSTILARS